MYDTKYKVLPARKFNGALVSRVFTGVQSHRHRMPMGMTSLLSSQPPEVQLIVCDQKPLPLITLLA